MEYYTKLSYDEENQYSPESEENICKKIKDYWALIILIIVFSITSFFICKILFH